MWVDWFAKAKVENGGLRAHTTALEQRIDTLESRFRTLKMEWEDVYDKLHKAAARLNARTRREKREDEEPPPAEPQSEQESPHSLGSHAMLTEARKSRYQA